jgi:aspartate aminotransferase
MIVANTIQDQLEHASWIRRMFEEGLLLKAERGAGNVFDFTLGNPNEDPPAQAVDTLRRLAAENRPGSHGYMPNAGFPRVREVLAERLVRSTGLPFTADHLLMTVGSSGAINTVLKALLDPGDEVIVPMPCFSEYPFYVANHAGRMVPVEMREDFSLDMACLAAAITPRTRAIILNSPHNPTGVVYSESNLRELDALLGSLDHQVLVISDEPYRAILYDGARFPETVSLIRSCVVAHSWSKSWALAGERIGYLAISPRVEGWNELRNACTFTNRILGFINAPAIWQWVVAETPEVPAPVALYQQKRDLLCGGLARIGYQLRVPQGAFYVFPKTPIPDDIAFVRMLQREGVLAVPGAGFGRAGYIRLSLTVPRETIEGSFAGFQKAFELATASR